MSRRKNTDMSRRKSSVKLWLLILMISNFLFAGVVNAKPGVVFEGDKGPGKGRHIVFVTGDEEYRSEESMPQIAKILAVHHGFKCTVLFAINKETGEIDPVTVDNIPGLEVLRKAELNRVLWNINIYHLIVTIYCSMLHWFLGIMQRDCLYLIIFFPKSYIPFYCCGHCFSNRFEM